MIQMEEKMIQNLMGWNFLVGSPEFAKPAVQSTEYVYSTEYTVGAYLHILGVQCSCCGLWDC